jgi:hypothetical protein
MSYAQGTVQRIATKQTKTGGTAWNVQLRSSKTGDVAWFGCGFMEPPFKEGDEVQFTYSGQWKTIERESVKILSRRPSQPGNTGNQQYSRQPAANSGKDAYWKNKEERDIKKDEIIQRQACRNTAIAFVDLALKHDAVALPTKKADRYDALLALTEEVAIELYNRNHSIGESHGHEEQNGEHHEPDRPNEPPIDFTDDLPF